MTLTRFLPFLLVLFLGCVAPAQSQAKALQEMVLGDAKAPLTVTEYASLTCSHCGDFYAKILPEIEKRYIATGKVRFVYRDFPIDGLSLKAAALAQCMPKESYTSFVKMLFNNMATWVRSAKPEATLIQFAQMAGMEEAKAKACMEDTAVLDALVAQRTDATSKYGISATPTFILGNGEEKIVGASSVDEFAAALDKALAKKK